jgi:hypothetical protein
MWTKRHDNFVLSQKKENKSIPPSAQLVWRFYERRRHQLGEEMDIDLEQCNKWIARQKGSGFERKTLKNAISLLESVGVITIVKKSHNWRDYRIILHGIEYICDRHKITPKKNSPKQEKFTTLPGHEPIQDNSSQETTPIWQQHQNTFTQIDELTRSIGLVFDRKTIGDFVRYGVDKVHKAIELWQLRSLTNVIDNPHGFIVSCLRWKWWKYLEQSSWRCSMVEMKKEVFAKAQLKLHAWTRKYEITYEDCYDLALELKDIVFEQ